MKRLALSLAALLTGSFLFAQTTPVFGIKAGVNVANFHSNTNENYDSRIGLHLGALAHIHLAPQFALQPEVQYSQEGTKFNLSGNSNTVTTKLDYINIPLMFQYMFDNGFRIEAGPQIGFLINAKYDADNGVTADVKNSYKSTNTGLGVGLNYLTYSGLGVGARYIFGLNDIYKDAADIKGRNLQLSLFYMLDNNHKAKSR